MAVVPASTTLIACLSPSDGVRLSQQLANPALWKSGTPAPYIEGNGGLVTLSWPTLAVASATVTTAITASNSNVKGTVTHTVTGGTGPTGIAGAAPPLTTITKLL